MREVWNAANDLDIPNEPKPKNTFDKICQIKD